MSRSVILQFTGGILLGGLFLAAFNRYGFDSPRTIWIAVAVILFILSVNLGELRSRIARLEKQAADPK